MRNYVVLIFIMLNIMQFDRHGAVRLWSWLPVLAVVVHVLVAWCRRLLRVPLPSTTRARAPAQREAQAPQVGVVVLEWMFPFSYFANTVVKIILRFILRITWHVSSYFAKKSVDKFYVTTKRKVFLGVSAKYGNKNFHFNMRWVDPKIRRKKAWTKV